MGNVFTDFLQGASNASAGAVSAPVDGLAWLLRKAGVPVGDAPVGGSQWMANVGLTAQPQNRVAGLLGEAAGGVAPMLAGAYAPQIARGLLATEDAAKQGAMAVGQKASDMAGDYMAQTGLLQPATVWHGSPHQFDAFDSSKIGTGEGAQAYGHGLYLADVPDVARIYSTVDRPMLQRLPIKDGKPYEAKTMAEFKASNILQATGDYEKAFARIERDMDGLRSNVRSLPTGGRGQPFVEIGDDVARELRDLQQAKASLSNMRQTGVSVGPDYAPSLYKVDLPDEMISRMLDWDKPLSQQAPEVQAAIERAQLIDPSVFQHYTGQTLYQGEMNARGPFKASGWPDAKAARDVSDVMRSAGITGIKYLDQGSRGAGAGTYNYVVFPGEENLLTILERNGAPVR